MEYIIFAITFLALFLLLFVAEYFNSKKNERFLIKKISEEYKNPPKRDYSEQEMANISALFEHLRSENSIDDITYNDIELENIYKRINYCKSSIGDAYLMYKLRTLEFDKEEREHFENQVERFSDNSNLRLNIQTQFLKIGRLKNGDFFDSLNGIRYINEESVIPDYLCILLLIISIILIFFLPTVGIVTLISVIIFNIITYYSRRGKIEPYLYNFAYINGFISKAGNISQDLSKEDFSEALEISELCKSFTGFKRTAGFVIGKNKGTTGIGNPLDILGDYLKMALHVDLIFFHRMIKFMKNNTENVEKLFLLLGKIETYISVCCYRASLDSYCKPLEGESFIIKNTYHPLIDNPVKNSIESTKSVLLTGSNASGKSTFLKTIAINICMAETINTVTADYYEAPGYYLFTSMALRDDLLLHDSYFMVEIKAIKRILDFVTNNPDKKVVCFVDEVLRGTNTAERIAASTEILKTLSNMGCRCFAATHDGELTYLLENSFENYHFEEDVLEDDVSFNYLLKSGRATSRNAIKLLKLLGFSEEIIDNANAMAGNFLETGKWIQE